MAIKVLPQAFAQDKERLDRFQREARLLAALNHPNIAAIYGVEQHEATHYLVLELVPGETLAERIARGPISVEEARSIASQIIEALEGAHEKAIIHRDLKPANIKLTPDDVIKVLDFGLAKALVEESGEPDGSMSPTISRNATRAGGVDQRWCRADVEPSWGRDFYREDESRMMVVSVIHHPHGFCGPAKLLFEGNYSVSLLGRKSPNYDVTPDGKQFLMVRDPEAAPVHEIRVVLNWFDELKRLVPVDE